MRHAILLLALAASAAVSAQPLRAPAWRALAGAGVTADGRAGAFSLGAERRVWGPLALGVRGAAHTDLVFETDTIEPASLRWTLETLASGTFRVAPRVDLRAAAGLGAASLSYPTAVTLGPGGLYDGPSRARVVETFAAVGVGADVYLLPGVGVGGEVRLVSSLGNPTASEASLGLRIRLPR